MKKYERRGTLRDKFWRRVSKHGPIPKHKPKLGRCWIWIGYISASTGYGEFQIQRTPRIRWGSHRLSWLLNRGEIPNGLWVLHKCDNPACVRPSHLWVGTPHDNTQDCVEKGRYSHGEMHGNSKLNRKKVMAIRAKRKGGAPFKRLSVEFGVSSTAIGFVCSGKTWKDC